uniref:Uncharacterized protein n=1 Tax=Alexandrium monilatum TaxID=311494 RepID=A0A7S4QAF8_9DINO
MATTVAPALRAGVVAAAGVLAEGAISEGLQGMYLEVSQCRPLFLPDGPWRRRPLLHFNACCSVGLLSYVVRCGHAVYGNVGCLLGLPVRKVACWILRGGTGSLAADRSCWCGGGGRRPRRGHHQRRPTVVARRGVAMPALLFPAG